MCICTISHSCGTFLGINIHLWTAVMHFALSVCGQQSAANLTLSLMHRLICAQLWYLYITTRCQHSVLPFKTVVHCFSLHLTLFIFHNTHHSGIMRNVILADKTWIEALMTQLLDWIHHFVRISYKICRASQGTVKNKTAADIPQIKKSEAPRSRGMIHLLTLQSNSFKRENILEKSIK